MNLDIISSNKSFGGWHKQYRHPLQCAGVRDALRRLPAAPGPHRPESAGALYLALRSHLHRRELHAKGGAQRIAAELGIALVAPDTSPAVKGRRTIPLFTPRHGARVPTSTPPRPWRDHYQMYRLRHPGAARAHRDPLPGLDEARHQRPLHGATAPSSPPAREPGRYRSVSAFSPISHPSRAAPGAREALGAYLGNNPLLWQEWDACQLLRRHDSPPCRPWWTWGWTTPSWRSSSASTPWPKWPPPGVAP